MTERELIKYLKERLRDDWREAWEMMKAHRRSSLHRTQRAAEDLFAEPGISAVRFRLELDYIVRLIDERGP